jgi:taurine transport system substrate-binding protein
MRVLKSLAITALVLISATANAAEKRVTIGYQTDPDPSKVAIADGKYEKATGYTIDWRKFDSGAQVTAALAAGSIDIGIAGSSPLAAAATRKLPIEAFLIGSLIGDAEALVVRNGSGIQEPKDFVGKKVAVPFVSTTHYSLLFALKHWGVDTTKVEILNLQPPEIAAAFQRGDIDAAYVWDPALGKAKETGKVYTSSAEVGSWGAPTFLAWIARKDFAAANPEFLATFARVTLDSFADYRKDPSAYGAGTANAAKIARLSGAKVEDIPDILKGSTFPLDEEQVSDELLGRGTAEALARTAAFLKEQKKVDDVLDDYSTAITEEFVRAATKTN